MRNPGVETSHRVAESLHELGLGVWEVLEPMQVFWNFASDL